MTTYHSAPLPSTEPKKFELKERQDALIKEASRFSVPCTIFFHHDSVAQQVNKLGPSTATKAWLNLLVAELTTRGF
jgi:hypothetical protein